jgi:hypothetical protein
VAYRNSTTFSTLEVRSRIWATSCGKTRLGWVWLDVKFDSTQIFFKKVPQSEFVCKSYDRFIEARPGYGSGRRDMTWNRNRVRQKLIVCDGKG